VREGQRVAACLVDVGVADRSDRDDRRVGLHELDQLPDDVTVGLEAFVEPGLTAAKGEPVRHGERSATRSSIEVLECRRRLGLGPESRAAGARRREQRPHRRSHTAAHVRLPRRMRRNGLYRPDRMFANRAATPGERRCQRRTTRSSIALRFVRVFAGPGTASAGRL
jgi:hypothetical protein